MYMVGDGVYNQPTNTNGYTLMLDLKGSTNKNNWDWENPQNGYARDQRDYHGDHSSGEVNQPMSPCYATIRKQ
jgi:hypothetical protein